MTMLLLGIQLLRNVRYRARWRSRKRPTACKRLGWFNRHTVSGDTDSGHDSAAMKMNSLFPGSTSLKPMNMKLLILFYLFD